MSNIIIIPYRNREAHLDYFLKNTVPLLNMYMKNPEVVVVEQEEGTLFNRGKLLNIGFVERPGGKYFFTHDVDINPFAHTIKDVYNKEVGENEIMGIYTSCANTLGGVIKFGKNVFTRINGFPNDIWGWGMEDICLQNRAEFSNVKITKNVIDDDKDRDKHFKVFNDVNDRLIGKDWQQSQFWEVQQKNRMPRGVKEMRLTSNGLSNLDYEVLRREKLAVNVEKISVKLGSSEGKGVDTALNEIMNKVFGGGHIK